MCLLSGSHAQSRRQAAYFLSVFPLHPRLSLETSRHFSKYCYLTVFQLPQMSGFSFLNLLWWRPLLKLEFLALKVSMGESTFHTETWNWLDGELAWGSFQATDWGVLLRLPGAMERSWCNTVLGRPGLSLRTLLFTDKYCEHYIHI